VHQILDSYFEAGHTLTWERGGNIEPDGPRGLPAIDQARFELTLPGHAQACTDSAVNADYAESRATEIYILREIAKKHLGSTHEATVTGGNRHGVFVQLDHFLIDAMIVARKIGADDVDAVSSYRTDIYRGSQVLRFRVGDRIKVRIEDADPVLRQLDVVPVGTAGRGVKASSAPGKGTSKGKGHHPKKGKRGNHRKGGSGPHKKGRGKAGRSSKSGGKRR